MDETRDPDLSAEYFARKADEFFVVNSVRKFETVHEAAGFIQATDGLIEIFLRKLAEEDATYSDELLLQVGSALGEAFAMLFNGHWLYSQKQQRWVVQYPTPHGDKVEVNVFRKVEIRFKNGDEDSILYMYDQLRKAYLDEAKEMQDSG